jgi:hypothetical protein
VKHPLLLLIVCLPIFSAAQQSFRCPKNSEDTLSYFVMSYPNRTDHYMGPGNANPIYSSIDPDLGTDFATSGTFFWVKSANGYPWDVDPFDQNFIYHRATELKWVDPATFKRQVNDMPISPRCVSRNGAGSPIQITPAQSAYSFYSNCQPYQTADLSYVSNSISKATSVNTGGNLGTVTTRYLTYKYACNSSYSSCGYMEVFALGKNIGLYDWKYYTNQNGHWVLSQESIINNFSVGHSTPYFACPNTVQ